MGHRYVVNLEAFALAEATKTDSVNDTLDYGKLAEVIVQTATSQQFRTIERLAQVIADQLLLEFSILSHGRISIAKPMPPMPFIVSEAGIRLEFRRSA